MDQSRNEKAKVFKLIKYSYVGSDRQYPVVVRSYTLKIDIFDHLPPCHTLSSLIFDPLPLLTTQKVKISGLKLSGNKV